MNSFYKGTLALGFLLVASTAQAQVSGTYSYDATRNAYFVQGDSIVNGDINGNDVFVGKDNGTQFNTLAGTATLTITTNANITGAGNNYPDGNSYQGVNVFGANAVAVDDGIIDQVYAWNNSTVTLTGGTTSNLLAFDDSSIGISGSTNLGFVYGNGNSILRLTGGTLTGDLTLFDTSTAYIAGSNLSFAVTNSWSGGDVFTVTGEWADGTNTPFSLQINDRNNSSGTPTGFVLQYAAVPESPTGLLLLLAVPLVFRAKHCRKLRECTNSTTSM